MNTQTITIGTKKYEVKFGIKSNIILGKLWKLKKLSEIGVKLSSINFAEGEEPTMDQQLILAELVLSGILSKQPRATVDADDVYNFITTNVAATGELMELYTQSLPQENASSSKNVNPDQRK